MTAIRVLIVEDDATVREELGRLATATSSELAIVGLYDTAESALDAMRRGLRVEVVLTDLRLPGMSGTELIATLRAAHSGIEIVVLTIYEDDDSLYGALRAGASGYLLKDASLADVTEAVRQVHQGGAPMSPSIARRVLLEFRRPVGAEPAHITSREREVLELLTKGASYPAIGAMLDISTSTVQTHIRAIYRKLEVSTKAEATAEAYRRGLVR